MFQAQNRETKLVLEKLLCPPGSAEDTAWRRAWQDCISQHNTKPPSPRPIFFVSDRSCPKTDGPDHITILGERCELPSWFREPWPPKDFSLFSALRMASPDSIILYYCGSKNEKFLTHSVLSKLLCIRWCCLIFLVYETKFTVGKWQVASLHCREEGEVDGGIRHLVESPKQCRIQTTWALAHRIN